VAQARTKVKQTSARAGARTGTARKRPSPRRAPAAKKSVPKEPRVLPIEVEASSIEKTLSRVREELTHWVNKGRYTKVRFKLRGKPILPDIPVGAVLAAEAATFWWAGLLRALLVTLGTKAVLDVELVSEADRQVARGREALLAGDLERAMDAFGKALQMDRDCASAHLSLGTAH
jgi:hypothetical protein